MATASRTFPPLSGLNKLESLRLIYNSISDVSALAGLTNLTVLNLGGNSISDISSLSSLTDLSWLGLWANSISDLAPLVANTGLGSEDEINVQNNPLSATSLNTHIPTLQSRGVTVYFSASKPAFEEKETRLPRAEMKRFGIGEQEEAEYRYHKQMDMKENMISRATRREIRSTPKTDARDRRRMEMRQDMISQKMSLRDKARREGK